MAIRNGVLRVLAVIIFSTNLSLNVSAQSKEEVIMGSYFVAFGRFPNSSELSFWKKSGSSITLAQMISNHRTFIKTNQYEREQTVKRSFIDAFGWQPSTDELRYWSGQNKTYCELMSNHIKNWLNVYPDKKEHVIRQSYKKVFDRRATPAEIKYWMLQPAYSFVHLVAIHTTWKQKNQAQSKLTSIQPGIYQNGISTAQLSEDVIKGVIAAGGGNIVAPGGGNIIAAGGGNVLVRR